MHTPSFPLVFRPISQPPLEQDARGGREYLLVSRCDGMHILWPHFSEGEFTGFRYWASDEDHGAERFDAWAALPDCTAPWYDAFIKANPR